LRSVAKKLPARRKVEFAVGCLDFRNRLEGVFQAFLAMAGATPSPDVPAFSRTGIDDPVRKFVIAVVSLQRAP
jgi:hypothetical protein